MRFNVDPALRQPLYQQLEEQLLQSIVAGELEVGLRLPSVRDLAIELRINPNTVARAYRELERSGWVESQAGRGVFVRGVAAGGGKLPQRVHEAVGSLLRVAREEGVDLQQIISELERRDSEESNKKESDRE